MPLRNEESSRQTKAVIATTSTASSWIKKCLSKMVTPLPLRSVSFKNRAKLENHLY